MIAVITGAYGGLGKEISFALWKKGYNLILIGRNKSKLTDLKKSLGENKDQSCKLLICDLSDEASISKIIDNDFSKLKKIDVLINNAAIHGPIDLFHKTSSKQWKDLFQVNFFSPVALTKAAVPLMKNDGGSIINISGGGATGPRVNFSAYASAKTSLVRFTEIAALELEKDNIRVNCVAPGMMPTKLLYETISHLDESKSKEFDSVKKVLTDENFSYSEVINLILFLTSDVSKKITGKLISSTWDNWEKWNENISQINQNNLYTLRRVTAKDKGFDWGDK